MKKLVITLSLVLALVIAAAVSLPALAAPEELGSTIITVEIGEDIIEVNVDGSGADMGGATPEEPGEATVVVSGGSNAENGCTITLEDWREAPDYPAPVAKGFMQKTDATALTNALGVQGPLEGAGWTDLTGDPVVLYVSDAPGTIDEFNVNFMQEIEYTDTAGEYSITVTFVGTANS